MRGQQLIQVPVPVKGLIANLPVQTNPPDSLLQSSFNVYVDLDGTLKPRKGYAILGTPAVSEQVNGIFSYYDYDNNFHNIVSTLTTWQDATVSPFTNITDPANPNHGTSDNFNQFTILAGSFVWVYGVNNIDPIRAWHTGLANYTTINGTNAPSTARTLLTLGGRIIAFNTTESGTNFFYRIRWSAINDGTTWPALGFLDLLDTSEEIISAKLTSAISAIVYTATNAYYLFAVPGPDSSAFAVEKVPTSDLPSGPVSPASVTEAEGPHYYLCTNAHIWTFNGTNIVPISDPVDTVLQNLVDKSNLRRAHTVFDQRYRIVWFFFPAVNDGGFPMHAIGYDLKTQSFTAIQQFSEPITASTQAVTTISATWLNWVSPTDTWLTIPYAHWYDVPITKAIVVFIGTATNTYYFFTSNSDNGAPIPYQWTSALYKLDISKSLNLTDFEVYLNPSTVTEQLTFTFQGLIQPYAAPTPITTYQVDASTLPVSVTLQAGPEQPRALQFPYLQVMLQSAGVAGGGMQLAGVNLWVNTLIRGNYPQGGNT